MRQPSSRNFSASDARRLLDGASDARRPLDGASDARRPLDGASAARRPIIDPFLLALKSRRVLIALSAILGGLIVLAVPSLTAVQGEILVLLITMALAVIGGYSLEDAARAARSTPIPPDFADQIRELVAGLLEELQAEE